MDVLKKIYKIIIILTIVSLLVTCLELLDVIDSKSETGLIITSIASTVLTTSILFSRNANVIANRKNQAIGFGVTFILLLYLLLFTAQLLFKFQIPEGVTTIISGIMIALTILVLILEIPQANSFHGTFQKIIVFLAIITFLLGYGYYDKSKKITEAFNENWDYTEYQEQLKSLESLGTAFSISLYITLGAFIINPMLRVHYLDIDYSNIDEIDQILTSQAKYQANSNPNPNKVLDDKFKKPNLQQQASSIPLQTTPAPVPELTPEVVSEPVAEIPHEKVINPNFKQEDLPEAIIPSLTIDEPIVEEASAPVVVETPTPVTEQPVASPEPANQAQEPTITSNVIEQVPDVSTPLTEVQQTNNQ